MRANAITLDPSIRRRLRLVRIEEPLERLTHQQQELLRMETGPAPPALGSSRVLREADV
jgi:hypothetical protein